MDKLQSIFERQTQYLTGLQPTYIQNGFLKHASQFPWDLDDRHYQEEFRLLAWRCVEEILEASETYETIHPANQGRAMYNEEVADALHFFVELCLVSGISQPELLTGIAMANIYDPGTGDSDINPGGMDNLDKVFDFTKRKMSRGDFEFYGGTLWQQTIRALGLAMMRLRQRPWRTDYRQADRAQWIMGMHLAFECFIAACIRTRINAEDLHEAYFKKAEVNDKRQVEFGA
jgi:dUTPase